MFLLFGMLYSVCYKFQGEFYKDVLFWLFTKKITTALCSLDWQGLFSLMQTLWNVLPSKFFSVLIPVKGLKGKTFFCLIQHMNSHFLLYDYMNR